LLYTETREGKALTRGRRGQKQREGGGARKKALPHRCLYKRGKRGLVKYGSCGTKGKGFDQTKGGARKDRWFVRKREQKRGKVGRLISDKNTLQNKLRRKIPSSWGRQGEQKPGRNATGHRELRR